MVTPKKRLGQHFLTDPEIARKTSELLLVECRNVIEIGPGKGILTDYMINNRAYNFKTIEIDNESIEYLNEKYPAHKNSIIYGDFLKTELKSLFEENSHFQIIGNFPYNISSQILFKVLEYKEYVDCISGMFQKEVAQRIISKPGNKIYGILSVLMQTWYDCKYCFTVNEGSFFPAPKVKSGVIQLIRNNRKEIDVDEQLFINIIKTSFNQRRKILRNSLRNHHINDCDMLSRRPETLSPDEFIELAKMCQCD